MFLTSRLSLANGFFLAPLPSVGRSTSCPFTSSTSKVGIVGPPFGAAAAVSGLSRIGSLGGSVALFWACAVLACCVGHDSIRFRSFKFRR